MRTRSVPVALMFALTGWLLHPAAAIRIATVKPIIKILMDFTT
jgi:hypothetical protein